MCVLRCGQAAALEAQQAEHEATMAQLLTALETSNEAVEKATQSQSASAAEQLSAIQALQTERDAALAESARAKVQDSIEIARMTAIYTVHIRFQHIYTSAYIHAKTYTVSRLYTYTFSRDQDAVIVHPMRASYG
eukprot:COSAG05_NODE_1221_length_5476_cov_72.306305_5_plen_135_part_00